MRKRKFPRNLVHTMPMNWLLRMQSPLVNWLIRKGFSSLSAKRLLTILNIFFIISILFILFPVWIAIISIIIFIIIFSGAGIGLEIEPPETPEFNKFKGGTDGFGYYDKNGFRIDCGSIDDEN